MNAHHDQHSPVVLHVFLRGFEAIGYHSGAAFWFTKMNMQTYQSDPAISRKRHFI